VTGRRGHRHDVVREQRRGHRLGASTHDLDHVVAQLAVEAREHRGAVDVEAEVARLAFERRDELVDVELVAFEARPRVVVGVRRVDRANCIPWKRGANLIDCERTTTPPKSKKTASKFMTRRLGLPHLTS
jgi:hypothetical protein